MEKRITFAPAGSATGISNATPASELERSLYERGFNRRVHSVCEEPRDLFAKVYRPYIYENMWTDEADAALVAMYNEGYSFVEMAQEFGVSCSSISKRIITLINFGAVIEREPMGYREYNILKAIPFVAGLYKQGLSIGQISRCFNLSDWQTSCIVAALRENGVITGTRAKQSEETPEMAILRAVRKELSKKRRVR